MNLISSKIIMAVVAVASVALIVMASSHSSAPIADLQKSSDYLAPQQANLDSEPITDSDFTAKVEKVFSVAQEPQVKFSSPWKKAPKGYQTIEWTDLIPKEDLDALMNPPSYITDIPDGAAEDTIISDLQNQGLMTKEDPYQKALVSTKVISEMDGQKVRIPGFIVPLEFDERQTVTQFFLVPFFGACLHLPPPPPNQIIFVNFPDGFRLESLYDPFWISGALNTTINENEVATAAYSLEMVAFEEYTGG